MLDWLIIGGGIHGTHLSLALTKRYGVPVDRLRVLDPYPTPLALWNRATANVGMSFLRSPLVHHLHYDQGSLGLFARIHEHAPYTRFIPPYSRPTLELFRHHSQYLIERYRLAALRLTGRAEKLSRIRDGWRVDTDHGILDARRVILAIGLSEQPYWPEWASQLRTQKSPITHIFAPDFDRTIFPNYPHITVVGGGITAAQTALALADTTDSAITLIMRHEIRQHDFDSDPGWMNAINLRDYAKITDFNQRRQVIRAARHRGSMPKDVTAQLQRAVEHKTIQLILDDEIMTATPASHDTTLQSASGAVVNTSMILLATGYAQHRPGGTWLEKAVQDYGLPTATCGYPIVDNSLCWSDNLYVSGPLAELEIGPAARNIVGARMAGERLGPAAR